MLKRKASRYADSSRATNKRRTDPRPVEPHIYAWLKKVEQELNSLGIPNYFSLVESSELGELSEGVTPVAIEDDPAAYPIQQPTPRESDASSSINSPMGLPSDRASVPATRSSIFRETSKLEDTLVLPSKAVRTASNVKKEEMEKYLRWEFKVQLSTEARSVPRAGKYTYEEPYDAKRNPGLVDPPASMPAQNINDSIIEALKHESIRLNRVELYFPEDWKSLANGPKYIYNTTDAYDETSQSTETSGVSGDSVPVNPSPSTPVPPTRPSDPLAIRRDLDDIFCPPFPGDEAFLQRVTPRRDIVYGQINWMSKLRKKVAELVVAASNDTEMHKGLSYLPRATIVQKIKSREAPNILMHEYTNDVNEVPQSLILEWLRYDPPSDETKWSEESVKAKTGPLFEYIKLTDDIKRRRDQATSFLQSISPFAPSTKYSKPDISYRISQASLPGWIGDTAPLILAGECGIESAPDDPKRAQLAYDDPKRAQLAYDDPKRAQLAYDLHPTLTLLTLFYLNIRSSAEDPIPRWLFVYGFTFTANTLQVYAHYPQYTNEAGKKQQWYFISTQMLRFDALTAVHQRVRALGAMLLVRDHSIFLKDQLQKWDKLSTAYKWLAKSEHQNGP